MKKRSVNCWLMHRKMVAAVAATSSQRHGPESLRTRVTSPSTGPLSAAWGSANTTLSGAAAVVDRAGAERLMGAVGDTGSPEWRVVGSGPGLCNSLPARPADYSNTGSIPAAVSAALRVAPQALANASLSSGGLFFRNVLQAPTRVSWRFT